MRDTTYNGPLIAPHRFAEGFHPQVWWSWLIGTAFFCGEIGGGLFLVSLLNDYWPGMIIGYLIVTVGKNTAHILYLGRPARFWRAAMRPDRSWIARGIWATGFFIASGFVVLFPHFLEPYWEFSEQTLQFARIVAGASAVFIMFYDGFVMNTSPSIPFWNTPLLPVLCLTYAGLGGTTLSLLLMGLSGLAIPLLLVYAEYFFLLFNLLLLVLYLFRMSRLHPAARGSVELLLRGAYASTFLGLVLTVGLFGTFLFSVLHTLTHWTWIIVLPAMCELVGDYALLMVLLKSGLLPSQSARSHLMGKPA
jgi:formate-dependent nitrite reductase membrane component NrfD